MILVNASYYVLKILIINYSFFRALVNYLIHTPMITLNINS